MSALQTKNRSYKDFHHSARLVPSQENCTFTNNIVKSLMVFQSSVYNEKNVLLKIKDANS